MKHKKILRWTGLAIALGLAVTMKFPVYAGDINAAEQMIIDYYNGTFYYDGKTYVATDAAKSSVYAKLAEDGVDLTEREARSAIRQASGRIGEGVEQGYLTEASSEGSGDGNAPENESSGQSKDENKTAEAGSENGMDKPGNGINEAGSGEGEAGRPGGNETDGSGNKVGQPGTGNGTGIRDSENENHAGLEGVGEGSQEELPSPFQKVDVSGLLEETQKEGEAYAQVALGGDFTITVERYLQGTVAAVSQEGYVLFEGGLPLKNTGYAIGRWRQVVIVLTVGLCITVGAAIWIWNQDRKKEQKWNQKEK